MTQSFINMEKADWSDINGCKQMHEYHISFFLEFDLPAKTIINLLQLIIGFWAYLGNFFLSVQL